LYGSSVGEHLISICFGNQICPDGQYRSNLDVLNSAQSGARSLNLDHLLDYLLGELDDVYKNGTVASTDWKLLTVFIGSNDICHACFEPTSLPPVFKTNVQAAIERIKSSVSNVLVQIGNTYCLKIDVFVSNGDF
jgi:phospholipase B1